MTTNRQRDLLDTRVRLAPARDLVEERPMRVSHGKRLPSWLIGLVLLIVIAVG